jgi:P2-related tail formation protein
VTPKEAEHWLIDNDFEYDSKERFPMWRHKRHRYLMATDMGIQEDPKGTVKGLREALEGFGATVSD